MTNKQAIARLLQDAELAQGTEVEATIAGKIVRVTARERLFGGKVYGKYPIRYWAEIQDKQKARSHLPC